MSTENKFEWTDDIVKEFFVENCALGIFRLNEEMMDFKKSKQQNAILKPPLGLLPLQIHRELRLTDINEAIERYNLAGKEIPKEWICEKETLMGWLQVEQKDWEILECDYYFDRPSCETLKIKSVKRISDGEVFSVGDEVLWRNSDPVKILGFEFIGESDYFVIAGNKESTELKEYLDSVKKELRVRVTPLKGITRYFLFSGISKVKQLLFKTEDNWFVYEKDTYPIYKVDSFWQILQFAACDCGNYEDAKYFKSKEKANEYILLNKPVLSVNDVYGILNKFENLSAEVLFPNYDIKLKELAKSKIENK